MFIYNKIKTTLYYIRVIWGAHSCALSEIRTHEAVTPSCFRDKYHNPLGQSPIAIRLGFASRRVLPLTD